MAWPDGISEYEPSLREEVEAWVCIVLTLGSIFGIFGWALWAVNREVGVASNHTSH